MNDTALHLTKRDMQQLATTPTVWIGLAAAGAILGLAAPFDTGAVPLLPRLLYWPVVVSCCFFLGTSVAMLLAKLLRRRRVGVWPSVLASGAIAGLANLVVVLAINWLVFRLSPSAPDYLVDLGGKVVIVSIIVTAAFTTIERRVQRDSPPGAPLTTGPTAGATSGPPPGPTPPRILDRLPLDKRAALISITVSDHYVEVTTAKGTELLLLRLSDAIAETGDTPGLQVHRSHWVAQHAVASVRREGARAVATLIDGRDIPVSRTYLPAIKEAGLLPG